MWVQPRFYYLLYVIGALVLSEIPVVHTPFMWLETYFHEISHGFAALLSGGKIEHINIRFDGNGVCYTRGGWQPLISFSGYAGASVWGGIIYMGARLTGKASRWLSISIVALIVMSAVLWVRDITTIVVLSIICVVLFVSFRYLIGSVFPRFMEFAGVYVMVSAIRAPIDLLYVKGKGDGDTLAAITHVPEVIWVSVWCLFAVAILYYVVKHTPDSR